MGGLGGGALGLGGCYLFYFGVVEVLLGGFMSLVLLFFLLVVQRCLY